MKAVNTRGKFDDIFSDKCLSISKDRLNNICKIEAGDKTCRYIVLGSSGFTCAKNTKLKEAIDKMVEEDKMTAKQDHCSGLVQTLPGILSNVNKKERQEKVKVKEKEEERK